MSFIIAGVGIGLMGAGAYFGSKKKGKGFETQIIADPYKTKVSSPLSEFLSKQVGKGLPRYTEATGMPLYEPLDPKAYNTYQNFLSMSPSEWYTKGVQEPTMKAMREEIPIIEEGWAGSLRGSGRYRDVEDYMADTAETLAVGRYKAELEIPKAQMDMAQGYSELVTKQRLLEYTDWYQSLPETNPALSQAMQFLNSDTGYNILARYNPGQSPWYADWFKGIGSMLAMYGMGGGAGGGASGGASGGQGAGGSSAVGTVGRTSIYSSGGSGMGSINY